jgi:terminase large subunit-like protein
MSTAALATRLSRLEALVEALTGTAPLPSACALLEAAGCPPDPWQQAVLQSQASRLLLVCSRQSGKTTVAAALALEAALHAPGSLTLILSPSLRQSQESFRRVLDLYRCLEAPMPTQAASALRLELANGARVVSLPGTESTVRGYAGVRLLVVDEAARVHDDLYYAIRPMLAVSGGRLLLLSTPWGKRGFFYEAYKAGDGWERVCIPATQCPRIAPQFLEEERRAMPRLWFESEYLCLFADTDSQVFGSSDVEACLVAPGSVVPWVLRED